VTTCFDTHAHLSVDEAPQLVQRARQAGVCRLIAVGGAPEENQVAFDLAGRFPESIRAAIGYDRYRATQADDPSLLTALFTSPDASRIRAVGEIGLDLHHAPDTAQPQTILFATMLALARSVLRPVIVHSREADQVTLDHLREHVRQWAGPADRVGVLHCFTGTEAFARKVLDLGFYLSFSGIVTFANAIPLRQVAAGIPSDRLLVETDSPYLTPVPLRGQKNEPAFLPHVIRCLAKIRDTPEEDLCRVTTLNAERLFGWEERGH
jgi:TatD DNase family protein